MELNIVNLIFVIFFIVMVLFSVLINVIEPYLPAVITQSFRYGKMSYKGEKSLLAASMEVPKSWFKHFYAFALVWSLIALYYVVICYVTLQPPPEYVLSFLDFLGGPKRAVEVDPTSALITIALITLQCCRRFYETHFLQIFSSNSNINLSHYLVGYLHYFGVIPAVLAFSKGFVRGTAPELARASGLNIVGILCILVFLYSWLLQYKSNIILVNLRKNENGKVVTKKHLMPRGGWFEKVSSPHLMFEVLMYISLIGVMPNNNSWRYVALWVLANQTEMAWLTHKWYKSTFKSYPAERSAIFPGII